MSRFILPAIAALLFVSTALIVHSPTTAQDNDSARIDDLEERVSELEDAVEAMTAEEPSTVTTGETHTITGVLVVVGLDSSDFSNSPGLGCRLDSRGYSDIYAGAQIRVTDGDGSLLATGRLDVPDADDYSDMRCQFALTIEDVPVADFYRIDMGQRGGLSFTFAEMESNDWHIELSLGN